ncbi:MAG: hypothetical protein ACWGNK_12570 [Desulfobacterales bacterium]
MHEGCIEVARQQESAPVKVALAWLIDATAVELDRSAMGLLNSASTY